MNIKIIVATHKKYWMPTDRIYVPIHVGAAINQNDFGYIKDNTGDNISHKNANYCELTALYWAWKNLSADYVGMVHYRRYFSKRNVFSSKKNRIIDKKTIESLLADSPVIVPKPRNYWIETNYSQYSHAHHAIDLDTTRIIIQEKYPKYIKAYDDVMEATKGHRFNMFIMRKDYFNNYCEWLFDILFELENRLDISSYSKNDARVFGFVSERLLDVWLNTNHIGFKDCPYVFIEKQNWLIKGIDFLKRKIKGSVKR